MSNDDITSKGRKGNDDDDEQLGEEKKWWRNIKIPS